MDFCLPKNEEQRAALFQGPHQLDAWHAMSINTAYDAETRGGCVISATNFGSDLRFADALFRFPEIVSATCSRNAPCTAIYARRSADHLVRRGTISRHSGDGNTRFVRRFEFTRSTARRARKGRAHAQD